MSVVLFSFALQILHDRILAAQAKKDAYEESRLREKLNKLPNDCTVNHLSELLSSESGTETDDAFSTSPVRSGSKEDAGSESGVSSSFDIISTDGEDVRATSSPIVPVEDEYDIIDSENESRNRTVKLGGRVASSHSAVDDSTGVELTPLNAPLGVSGKSDSSDTLQNESDSDSEDLDELVRRNTFAKDTKRSNRTAEELNNNLVPGRPGIGNNDVIITVTSTDNVTSEVFAL